MRLVLLVIPVTVVAVHVQADDGDLQRALVEAACPNAKITRLKPIGQSEVFEANCFGRRFKIVCTNGRCSAHHSSHSRDDPE
jgi:hypothetical protein